MTVARRALVEALAHLLSTRSVDGPDEAATAVEEHMAARGFSVQPMAAPVLHDLSPATLQRVREALGVTVAGLVAEARLRHWTMSRAEIGETRPHAKTLKAISEALVRLGARRPE